MFPSRGKYSYLQNVIPSVGPVTFSKAGRSNERLFKVTARKFTACVEVYKSLPLKNYESRPSVRKYF